MNLNTSEILGLEDRYRRNLINSLLGPKSVVLVGSVSVNGIYNLAPFSQVFHVGANPPLAGLLFRPDSVPRHTLTNIRNTGFFTIQSIAEAWFAEAHQCSARYPKEVSEFEAMQLEPETFDGFAAPFVKNAKVKIGLSLKEEINIAINKTILVVGMIEKLIVPDDAVEEDGFLNPMETGAIAAAGLDSYYSLNHLARLKYAKPHLL
ncbi:MAG: flavin reductase [Bacteroidetes bacterium]|nr:flavin reductase [Bacteroidota bacterium]